MCRSGDEDHPRRCGENACRLAKSLFVHGSPPQVRGKRRGYTYSHPQKRITPAGAGKTGRAVLRALQSTDHPRRCGENIVCGNSDYNVKGSPPQVRGKHVYHEDGTGIFRITPAGAGKTSATAPFGAHVRDHPRRCGENVNVMVFTEGTDRITPAGAGKTSTVSAGVHSQQDHPRRCGENDGIPANFDDESGSPPQVRGKRKRRP